MYPGILIVYLAHSQLQKTFQKELCIQDTQDAGDMASLLYEIF